MPTLNFRSSGGQMAKTKANEREFQGQVAVWIHKQIEAGAVPFQNATTDSSLYGLPTTRFPDVLVTLDKECHESFCGWELKTPTTSVRDAKLLKNACEKAKLLDSKYFVTWNMQSAVIWKAPSKHKATVNEDDKVREYGPYPITDVNDLRDTNKAVILQELCNQLLKDLGRLYKDEYINLPVADTTVFVNMVGKASEELAQYIRKDIEKAIANKSFNKKLDAWAKKQGINKYDQEYRQTLAQQIAYRLIGKILFYISLRRSRLELPRMELPKTNYKTAHKALKGFFQKALEIDYQAIFEPEITDEIDLTKNSMDVLVDLTDKLEHWSFELMPQDVIGNVFEHLISQDARHSLGQYFTPDNLVDLIISFCIREDNDFVMDPTCGTGSFLIRSYQKLQGHKRKKHHEVLNQIWGFDIAGFPAELATINLCRQDFSDYLNFPRVLTKDFFDVHPGEEFEFPPPKVTAQTGERIKIKIPEFDALVGNFPFIRQELIEKAEKGYKNKIEKVLVDNWNGKYQGLTKDDGSLRLSGQADIYAYMYFHAAAHLKEGGRMGFITSNSWLDVAYGYELQRFFLSKFKIIAICESRCEPWFEQSAVNTVFTILERCNDAKQIANNTVRFVKLKKPLSELFPGDPLTESQQRWIHFSQFVENVEGIGATGEPIPDGLCHKFKKIESEYVNVPDMLSFEDDDIRLRIIKQKDLANEVMNSDQTVKWGPYLRAPDVYFELLEKNAKSLVPLDTLTNIRRGFTTGINDFFYLDNEQIEHWKIEEEFVKPAIKSPKESERIFLNKNSLKQKVFLCHKDKAELKGTNALRYIKWGEEQATGTGQKWSDVPSVSGRRNWYELPDRRPGQFLVPMITGSSLRCIINKENVEVDHNLFEILSEDKDLLEALGIYLNSCVCFIQRELIGRANLGDGALKIEGIDWKRILVPNKGLLQKIQGDCKATFKKICNRKIHSIEEEAKRKDRIEFEQSVLKAIGLKPTDAESILQGVVDLVEERHLLPKLRKTKKKARVERDTDKLCDEVAEEVFAEGLSRFPEGFVKNWGRVRYEETAISAGMIKLGDSFFGKQEICDENGKHLFEVGTIEKGKFLVYAKKKDEHIVKVPVNETVLVKAVQDYECYLVELKDKFIHAFIDQCGDRILAENLTRKVFEDYNLPLL